MKNITTDEYFRVFNEYAKFSNTYKEAYEKTENEFFKKFGANKFSSYGHFKTVKSRRQNKKVNNAHV